MRDFLSAILTPATGYGELRAIHPITRHVSQQFFPLGHDNAHADMAAEAARFDAMGWDSYYGVLRRQRPAGTTDSVVDRAPILWADLDGYKDHEACDWDHILTFPVPPSVIVDSGHGHHVYWLLKDAMPIGDATLAMKGIARDIGGDKTWDAARVLRIPGLTNHKNPDQPMPVRLLRLDSTRRYNSGDFAEWIDRGGVGATPHAWTTGSKPRRDIPVWLDELIRNGAGRGQRSEACFKAMVWLRRYGWDYNEILSAFVENLDGIGAKMAERSHVQAQKWFDTTYKAAEVAA